MEDTRNKISVIWRKLIKEKYGIDISNFDLDEILRHKELNEIQRQQAKNVEFTKQSGRSNIRI